MAPVPSQPRRRDRARPAPRVARLRRARALLGAEAAAAAPATQPRGWLDLLGDDGTPPSTGRVQDLMLSRTLPVVYERFWRPAWSRVLLAPLGGMEGEQRAARRLLDLGAGDVVLDVACGPGNFTRRFAAQVGGEGLAVGIDASATMLDRAIADTPGDAIAYVRGDAVRLPFADASFDAVCCFAALHLFAEPWVALDHMVRVLKPGGRLALLASVRRGIGPPGLGAIAERASGVRLFGARELTGALQDRGLRPVTQRTAGLAQLVGGVRPAAG